MNTEQAIEVLMDIRIKPDARLNQWGFRIQIPGKKVFIKTGSTPNDGVNYTPGLTTLIVFIKVLRLLSKNKYNTKPCHFISNTSDLETVIKGKSFKKYLNGTKKLKSVHSPEWEMILNLLRDFQDFTVDWQSSKHKHVDWLNNRVATDNSIINGPHNKNQRTNL
ncbi:hypothetical protein [Lactiplantibacillus songbeiensis]|uniref:RNase H type-1 domain-containing protein n=1 Tax=Lactiplantibacillus songbeiensis TaxID=2559920 RepID=A0ABW4C3Y1_9LACO|nr:hypothetical protein [Lactiplantibacillus songbeiensis]